jgi:hypothetical protein
MEEFTLEELHFSAISFGVSLGFLFRARSVDGDIRVKSEEPVMAEG